MIFQNEDKVHGTIFRELLLVLNRKAPDVFARVRPGFDSRSAYFIDIFFENTEKIRTFSLFIKMSQNRRSPWRYSFSDMHQLEVSELQANSEGVFVLFAAGSDGVACISYPELKEILDEEYEPVEWVDVRRRLNESYRISGSNGKRDKPVRRNSFPDKIITRILENI